MEAVYHSLQYKKLLQVNEKKWYEKKRYKKNEGNILKRKKVPTKFLDGKGTNLKKKKTF